MPVQPLPSEKLRRVCAPENFTFATTAELSPDTRIIGQPRGTRAIEFGIDIQSQGYNTYVMGPSGTGRATTIERFLRERVQDRPVPDDWVYVHNFSTPHQPRAVELPAGEGSAFKTRMARLISDVRADLSQAFSTETYRDTVEAVRRRLETGQNEILQALQLKAAAEGFALINTPAGFVVVPVRDGRQVNPAELQQMPPEQRQALEERHQVLTAELKEAVYRIHQLETATRQQLRQIDRDAAEAAVHHHFADVRALYQGHPEVLLYLEEVHQDVLNQVHDFAPQLDSEAEIDLRRYEVNLLVDNSDLQGAPVVIEMNPTYANLIGRIEYEMLAGVVTTHFTNIKAGSLHRANGGYLIMEVSNLLRNLDAWEALKRALKAKEVRVQPLATMDGNRVLAKSLDPEPIALAVKIILMGSVNLYYLLYEQDEDFRDLFKVRADFDYTMPRTPEHEQEYAVFIATRCREESLHPFDASAVAKVIEFGSRLAGYQEKLSTRFGAIADMVREASYWAGHHGRQVVTAQDVQQALAERTYRANRLEENTQEDILTGSLFIATEGAVTGQVNGLTVIDTGDYSFGQPGRITARTFMGEEGVVHIERETDMDGPIHQKGVLTLIAYLGGTYAQRQPLSVSASVTFEQNYASIEGDSAASTELYALLSSLSEIPIRQGIAVTGSVNQRGEVQPIGGVNEKVEGFFRTCQARGLTGEQGVIVPANNVDNLMLHEDVIAAVAEGKFHIWPVRTIDQGIELLTGLAAGERGAEGNFPEGTVHYAVQKRLLELAEELKAFGENDDDD